MYAGIYYILNIRILVSNNVTYNITCCKFMLVKSFNEVVKSYKFTAIRYCNVRILV